MTAQEPPLLSTNRDLLPLALMAPERISAWSDQWVSFLNQGERDPRAREIAQIYRIGYHAILDHAVELGRRERS